jgi:hypothetical protein
MKRGGPLKRYTPLRSKGKLRRSKSKTNYKKRLWALVSEYVRRKAADHAGNATCVSCGSVAHWKKVHAGHYIAKSLGNAIYFDERNVNVQCVACNLWRHGNLAPYALYLLKTYGPRILDELDALRRTETQLREPWYLEQIELYKSKLSALEAKPEAA